MFNRESRSQPRMQTLIGPTVRVHGDVEFTGGMHVDGHVSGGVRAYGSEESSVSVSVTGIVDGAVVATHVWSTAWSVVTWWRPARWPSGRMPRCSAICSTV